MDSILSHSRLVTCDLHTYFTSYCMRDHKQIHSGSGSWSGCNWGAAAEASEAGYGIPKLICAIMWV